MYLIYAYPKTHRVSFTLIAEKHIEYMKKINGVRVYEVNEQSFPTLNPVAKPTAFVHPAIFIMHKVASTRVDHDGNFVMEYYKWWKNKFNQIIGIDVCDSDRISDFAVFLLNLTDQVVVPSRLCVEVYKKSGVKVPVHRVPHGVDPEWYEIPNVWETMPVASINPSILQLYLYKLKRKKKIILYWLWHSADRKGWEEVYQTYLRLVKERNDVVLVLKTMEPNIPEFQQVVNVGAINVYGWLDDYNKMALYDIADVNLNFSRGGGFELNCLESLARGVPCISSNWGSWVDYVPPFLQVPTEFH